MLIDTHCHTNFSTFKNDADKVIQRSLDDGIWLINVGSQYSTSERAVHMAKKYSQGVYAVIGLHPIHLYEMEVDEAEQGIEFKSRAEKFDYELYKELAQDKKVVGIGEMGIDYFHLPEMVSFEEVKAKQKDIFLQGIKLAKEVNKPIIIHTRPTKNSFDAYNDVIDIIKQANYTKGVVHCYGGNLEQAKYFIDLGLHISFTGILTFKNAKNLQNIAKQIPLEKIMVETDAPYLSPVPYRGQRNEPSYVKFVAQKIAELKEISYDKVAEVTTNTARKFYGI